MGRPSARRLSLQAKKPDADLAKGDGRMGARVYLGGIRHESCGFTPLRTSLEQFSTVRAPWPLARRSAVGEWEGAVAVLDGAGLQCCEGLDAGAAVSGLVERSAWDALADELVAGVRATRPDGVLLSLHGSLAVDGLDDAQGDLLAAVRAAAGADVPLVCTLDLHASVSPVMVRHADALVGYRTAPHRDQRDTGARGAALLVRMLTTGRRPTLVQARLPLLLPGEFAQTDTEPTASLWRRAEAMQADPAVWSVSLLDGFPWADTLWNEASVVVVADAPPARARGLALDLAAAWWAVRADCFRSVSTWDVVAGLAEAGRLAAAGCAVVVSDAGDNPTAGAPQDDARILAAVQAAGLNDAVVALLVDPPAVAAAVAAGRGGTVALRLGGALGSTGLRLPLTACVERIGAHPAAGRVVVLAAGGLRVVVGERRFGMTRPEFLEALGIEPLRPGRVLVLKIGYLFPAYADRVAADPGAKCLLLRSPGATSLDLASFTYRRRTRPAYPLDAATAWDGTSVSIHQRGPTAGRIV